MPATDSLTLAYYPSATAAVQSAQRYLAQRLSDIRQPLLLLSSGGSALAILAPEMSRAIDRRVTIGVLDERYSFDPASNNFSQLAATEFFQAAVQRQARFIDTRVKPGETLPALAARFGAALRAWRERNPQGEIIITQGIGADGHTAGIMPWPEDPKQFNELFELRDVLVRGYSCVGKNPFSERVTVTLPWLRSEVRSSVALVVGKEKTAALRKLMASIGTLAATPARIMREMKEVRLFTDIKL